MTQLLHRKRSTRRKIRRITAYFLLLLLSHGVQGFRGSVGREPSIWPPEPADSPAPVLLLEDPLHASAPDMRELIGLGGVLHRPIIAVELPGLNTRERGDHTFESLAERIRNKVREQHVPSVVLLANAHAGAVALHLAADSPDLIQALVLLDASGVEEFSLLGDDHLNHGLYAISHLALRLFDLFVPHFGLFPRLEIRESQLGLLRGSDRRKLRPLFDRIVAPTLILQHQGDPTNFHAAGEHMRLIPQSVNVDLDRGDSVLPHLAAFLAHVDAGQAPGRIGASPERMAAADAALEKDRVPKPAGKILFLLMLALALGTLVTEDLTCVIAALMIANGNLTWAQGIGACLGGILFGDYLLYLAGRRLGRPALQRVPLRWMIDPLKLRETEEWFLRRGGIAILISRFIPGTRLPAYVAAGILGVSYPVFTFYFVLAAVIWTPAIIWLAVLLSETALDWVSRYSHTAPALIVGLTGFYLLFRHVMLPSCSWRGRRKLLGRWKRLTRPEYWPTSLLYPPVCAFLALRCLRRGNHFLDFTACNPCMPASGLVGESKLAILGQFKDRTAIAEARLLPEALPLPERLLLVRDFMAEQATGYPVVIKPDVGQRGSQVVVAHDEHAVRAALEQGVGDLLAQTYIPGVEFGVFYVREPDKTQGRIIAITRKTFRHLTGDGRHNVEDLILKDPRAVCQAGVHFRELRDRLYDIPAAGEILPLTEVGNHARGTLFEDGMDLLTPALSERIDAISQSLPGFYFGRYDIRVPTVGDFQAGRDLKVIELNGVTSEATSLYDPKNGYTKMVAMLIRQWDLACRIGRMNREAGQPLAKRLDLIRRYDEFRQRDIHLRIQQKKRDKGLEPQKS